MTKYADLFAALAAPFERDEVKVRSQAGRQLQYVTARTVMNRLDNVLGPDNWWDDYTAAENSVLCRLTIRLPDGSTLTKQDAGGYAGMADSGDDDKSGHSDALKRAAVKFGVSRYLYRDGVPTYPDPRPDAHSAPAPAGPSKVRDERTCWQLVVDETGRMNDQHCKAIGKPAGELLTDPHSVAGRLLWLAVREGKSAYVSSEDDTVEAVAVEMERVYANHRQWVRASLKAHLAETLDRSKAVPA